jgi:hypothetical protein
MTDRDQWAALVQARTAKPHKYGAVKTVIDGIAFDSKREANRYRELKLRQMAGEIRDLELQPTYPLVVRHHIYLDPPIIIGTYTPDFRYREGQQGLLVIEDVKSKATKTEAYRLRKKFVEAQYSITIREV